MSDSYGKTVAEGFLSVSAKAKGRRLGEVAFSPVVEPAEQVTWLGFLPGGTL